MKKRNIGGAAIVIGLAAFLAQFFNFGGFGTGEGDGPGESDAVSTVGTEDSVVTEDDLGEPADLSEVSVSSELPSTLTTPNNNTQEFITVAIHGDKYRLTTESDPTKGTDIKLPEVVRQVTRATGGTQGVKLRVLLFKNAQEGAIADLYTALNEADVEREEIQEITNYVD